MHPLKIAVGLMVIIGLFAGLSHLFTTAIVPPSTSTSTEVTADRGIKPPILEEITALINPVPMSDTVMAEGKVLYLKQCAVCHGEKGKGDGPGGAMIVPPPTDFTNKVFQNSRSDGEIFWVMREGIPQTGMFSYVPRMISEEQAWRVIHYLRSL